jgi:hypothetical protein
MAFGVALALAIAVLAANGTDPESLRLALRVTGRWSFLLFWLAYAGGALAALCGRALAPISGHGRDFGLAYAAAHLVHLGLVIRLVQITSRPPLPPKPLVLFTVALVLTYLLAVFSVGGFSRVLGSKGWQTLRFLGINYILFVFAIDFVTVTIRPTGHSEIERWAAYAPFAAMCVAAPFVVIASAAHRRLGLRYSRAGLEAAVD